LISTPQAGKRRSPYNGRFTFRFKAGDGSISGVGGAVQFAALPNKPVLTASEFIIL
jgi:hypothetical protein